MPEKRRYFMMGNALVCGLIKTISKEIKRIVEEEDKSSFLYNSSLFFLSNSSWVIIPSSNSFLYLRIKSTFSFSDNVGFVNELLFCDADEAVEFV